MPTGSVHSNRLTKYANDAVMRAQEQASVSSQPLIEPEHLFLGILSQSQNQVVSALRDLGVSPFILIAKVDKTIIQRAEPLTELPQLSRNTKQIIKQAFSEANVRGIYYVGTEHLALAMTSDKEGTIAKSLVEVGISIEKFHTSIFISYQK